MSLPLIIALCVLAYIAIVLAFGARVRRRADQNTPPPHDEDEWQWPR